VALNPNSSEYFMTVLGEIVLQKDARFIAVKISGFKSDNANAKKGLKIRH
jgi:hypothetical protein